MGRPLRGEGFNGGVTGNKADTARRVPTETFLCLRGDCFLSF